MKHQLQRLIGHHVTVYGVAEGMSLSFRGPLVGPAGIGAAFSVGSEMASVTFHPGNVKHLQGLVIELNVLEPRTHKMVKKHKTTNKQTI